MKRYSKLQTCPLVILYSISANSPSKQQGGGHIVIGAMGSVDRVITLGGVMGGRKPQTGIIYIYKYGHMYIYIYKCILTGVGKKTIVSLRCLTNEWGLLKSPLAYSSSEPTKDHLGFELSTIYYMIHGDH